MKGKDLKIAMANDGRLKQDLAGLLGISRQKLNDLEKVEVVPPHIIEKAISIGLKFPTNGITNVADKGKAIPIEALEFAERLAESVRADFNDRISDYNERISELNRTIEFLMTLVKEKKKVA